jgi:hypothetical protein
VAKFGFKRSACLRGSFKIRLLSCTIVTVAILAQGTHWAVAHTQAFPFASFKKCDNALNLVIGKALDASFTRKQTYA